MAQPITMLPPALAARLDEMAAAYDALSKQLEDPEVLADHRKVRDVSIQRAAVEGTVLKYRRLIALARESEELEASIDSGEDAELAEMAREELPRVRAEAERVVEEVKAGLVNADDMRVGSVILELRAGTGGDEAGLWCRDLLKMYERYAVIRSWSLELMDISEDDGMGGVRSAIASVRGEGVWSELGFEAGVHSVKRVPATESQGRIHTSTATVAVLPEPEEVGVSIDWAGDVDEHVTTSQGPGGQNVNKVATAVVLVHKPTGITVRMQETKSQQQNREKARRLLMARVHEVERLRLEAERLAERRGQIGGGGRSEKIRTYRYQEGVVVDQRLDDKFPLAKVLAGELGPMMAALLEQETARRLADL